MNEAETITISMQTVSGEPGPVSVIPRKIGSVRLIREVGKGGMGVVWLGRDDFLGRDIAVKFLLSAIQSQEDPGFVTFLEGARAAAAVHAPGLLTVYAADVVDAVPYIVMEFVDGPTVSRVVRTTGPLSLQAALGVLETVCSAVAALHDHGIIHRDIKPANLLLNSDAKVFVTDFGLACPRPTGMVGKVAEGVSGTPHYMAPEMFEGNLSVRTDVYALGVVTYELLTGELPFTGTLEVIREGHQKHALPMEMLLERRVPAPLIEVIERATHKNFVFRYKTARHFLNALHEAVTDQQTWARGPAQLAALVARCVESGRSGASEEVKDGQADRAPGAPAPVAPTATPTPGVGTSYYDLLATRAVAKRLEDTLEDMAPVSTPDAGSDLSGVESVDSGEARDTERAAPLDSFQELGFASGETAGREENPADRWPVSFGVGAMVLALLSGVYQCGSLLVRLLPATEVESGAAAHTPGVWEMVSACVGLLLAGLLLVSGIGVLRRSEWGVAAMYCWCGLALLWGGIGVAVAVWLHGFLNAPLTLAVQLSPESPEIARRLAVLMLVFGSLWRLVWPLAALLWLRRPSVRSDIARWDAEHIAA